MWGDIFRAVQDFDFGWLAGQLRAGGQKRQRGGGGKKPVESDRRHGIPLLK